MFGRYEDFNIILATDGYKMTHWKQYPPGTEVVYSYLESRGGKFPSTIFFGLQYFLKRYLEGQVVTREKIDEAEEKLKPYFGADYFNREGWEYILEEHGGHLPIRIKAVPEGTDVPTGNVLMTIENTDPKCFWLPNYLETMLVEVWYPITVATLSNYVRRKLLGYLRRTGSDAGIDYMFHDFGYRGVSSQESAALGGAGHLLNFMGTDTFAAVELLREYYPSRGEGPIGVSIPASEHSTITSWGADREVDAFRNMLRSYPTGTVACVSDSYNIWRACEEYWGTELRMEINSRDGVLVVRPDSGEPALVDVKCLNLLGKTLGATENEKGFKVLNPRVRVIQGDGIKYETLDPILEAMIHDRWAAENIAFGSGGGLLQQVNRDTQRFAFKCSAIRINGEWKPVFKDPVTDPNKRSKKGRLRLVQAEGVAFSTTTGEGDDKLLEVFLNGDIPLEYALEDLRELAHGAAS